MGVYYVYWMKASWGPSLVSYSISSRGTPSSVPRLLGTGERGIYNTHTSAISRCLSHLNLCRRCILFVQNRTLYSQASAVKNPHAMSSVNALRDVSAENWHELGSFFDILY